MHEIYKLFNSLKKYKREILYIYVCVCYIKFHARPVCFVLCNSMLLLDVEEGLFKSSISIRLGIELLIEQIAHYELFVVDSYK